MATRTKSSGLSARIDRGAKPSVTPRPGEYQCDPLLWASWLYHHDEMTQSQIADLMGVSRATVVNYLQQAREQHYVKVVVRPELLNTIDLAQRLKSAFGLGECMVIPSDGGLRPPSERIGRAGAQYLDQELSNGDVLGVAWGHTVLALAENLPEKIMPESSVVQVIGSQRGAYDGFTAEECVAFIARRLHARSINLHAPASLSSAALRDALLLEPTIQEQFTRIRSCNKLLFGICTVKTNSLVFASGLISVEESKYFIAKGAVGVIAGRFYDAQGKWIRGTMDDRMIGITLDDVLKVPTRIAVAGGPDKTDAILGALRGGLPTALITDEPTARNILNRL
ncbi:sugar-binding transcriptional regulator [Siculibacillus lacustris]|nr:sugar-binding transcriptional regulator [Siculibacillus lacustris]